MNHKNSPEDQPGPNEDKYELRLRLHDLRDRQKVINYKIMRVIELTEMDMTVELHTEAEALAAAVQELREDHNEVSDLIDKIFNDDED